jgi:nicotinamidase/pyrazinamidase
MICINPDMEEQLVSIENTGVIVVDVLADFTELKSGSLAVPGTDAQYINAVQRSTQRFLQQGLRIYFTQDWHPADHVSFYTNNPDTQPLQVIEINGRSQVMWPPHSVQGTSGAEIVVTVSAAAKTVRKGTDPRFDSYSGFADDGGHKTQLDSLLRKDGIQKLIIYGLATDYCVKATVLDALEAGYQVELVLDLCRGISPETTAEAIEEMKERGAKNNKGLNFE